MDISTNQKPTIYRNLYENTGPGNIHDVLNFANFERNTNSLIKESRENYHYNSATEEEWKFANSKLCEKYQNQKFAKI